MDRQLFLAQLDFLDAVEKGDLNQIKQIMDAEQHRVEFSRTKIQIADAVILAAEEGRLEVVEFLLDNGFDTDEVDAYGYTALHKAILNGNILMAKLLIEEGNDIGTTSTREGYFPLHLAVLQNDIEMVRFILNCEELQGFLDIFAHNRTAYKLAKEKGYKPIMKLIKAYILSELDD